MRTQGPRMNADRTREVLDKLGIKITKSNELGVEIQRVLPAATDPEIWRLRTDGGIVANSHQVWLLPVLYRMPIAPYKTRGPYWNKTQLAKALRLWRSGK